MKFIGRETKDVFTNFLSCAQYHSSCLFRFHELPNTRKLNLEILKSLAGYREYFDIEWIANSLCFFTSHFPLYVFTECKIQGVLCGTKAPQVRQSSNCLSVIDVTSELLQYQTHLCVGPLNRILVKKICL